MSLSQKVILGSVITVFVIGIGWALQYVSNNNLNLGKGNNMMMNVATDEEQSDIQPRSEEGLTPPVSDQGVTADPQQLTTPATIGSRVQAEQALLEIESAFGEIEANINVNE